MTQKQVFSNIPNIPYFFAKFRIFDYDAIFRIYRIHTDLNVFCEIQKFRIFCLSQGLSLGIRVQFCQHCTCSFYAHRSRECKKYSQAFILFSLLGTACIKAEHKMLVKLTPGISLIPIELLC